MVAGLTDNFGSWVNLGTVTAFANQWVNFPTGFVNADVFRLTFALDWGAWETNADYLSFGLLRFVYISQGDVPDTIGETFRIYPNSRKQIIERPIPDGYNFPPSVMRIPSIRKVIRRYPAPPVPANLSGNSQGIPWSLKIEALPRI